MAPPAPNEDDENRGCRDEEPTIVRFDVRGTTVPVKHVPPAYTGRILAHDFGPTACHRKALSSLFLPAAARRHSSPAAAAPAAASDIPPSPTSRDPSGVRDAMGMQAPKHVPPPVDLERVRVGLRGRGDSVGEGAAEPAAAQPPAAAPKALADVALRAAASALCVGVVAVALSRISSQHFFFLAAPERSQPDLLIPILAQHLRINPLYIVLRPPQRVANVRLPTTACPLLTRFAEFARTRVQTNRQARVAGAASLSPLHCDGGASGAAVGSSGSSGSSSEGAAGRRGGAARGGRPVGASFDFVDATSAAGARGCGLRFVQLCCDVSARKHGDIVSELVENLAGPQGGCPYAKHVLLHRALEALRCGGGTAGVDGAAAAQVFSPLQMLLLLLLSLDGPGIDGLMGFDDVPSARRRQRRRQQQPVTWSGAPSTSSSAAARAAYRQAYTDSGLRNPDLLPVLSAAVRAGVQGSGGAASHGAPPSPVFRWCHTLLALMTLQKGGAGAAAAAAAGEGGERRRRGVRLFRTMTGVDAEAQAAALQEGGWLASCLPAVHSLTPLVSRRHVRGGHVVVWEVHAGAACALPSPLRGSVLLPALSHVQVRSVARDVEFMAGVVGTRVVAAAHGPFGGAHAELGGPEAEAFAGRVAAALSAACGEDRALRRLEGVAAMAGAASLVKCELHCGFEQAHSTDTAEVAEHKREGLRLLGDERWPVMRGSRSLVPVSPEVMSTHGDVAAGVGAVHYSSLVPHAGPPPGEVWLASHSCVDVSHDGRTGTLARSCVVPSCRPKLVGRWEVGDGAEWYVFLDGATRGVGLGVSAADDGVLSDLSDKVWTVQVSLLGALQATEDIEYVTLRYDRAEGVLCCLVNGEPTDLAEARVAVPASAAAAGLRPCATLSRVGNAAQLVTAHRALGISKRRLSHRESAARRVFEAAALADVCGAHAAHVEATVLVVHAAEAAAYTAELSTVADWERRRRVSLAGALLQKTQLAEYGARATLVKRWLTDVDTLERQALFVRWSHAVPAALDACLHRWPRGPVPPAAAETSGEAPYACRCEPFGASGLRLSLAMWARLPSRQVDVQFFLDLRCAGADGGSVTVRTCSDGCGEESRGGCNVCVSGGGGGTGGEGGAAALRRSGIAAPFFFEQDRWVHIAAVFTPTSLVLYRDGQRVEGLDTPEPLLQGMTFASVLSACPEADLRDVRVYGRNLTAADVGHLFTQTNPEDPEVAETTHPSIVAYTMQAQASLVSPRRALECTADLVLEAE